jgi:integration host factor subunit beta
MVGNKYTKAEIVDSIYEKSGINRRDIRDVIELVLDEIKTALIDHRVIELRGFGTFEVKIRKGRQKARNPRTGETLSVSSHGTAVFRAGRELKQQVWNLKTSPAGCAPGQTNEPNEGDKA